MTVPAPPHSQPVPIAFCITDLDAGGAERALVNIVTRLDPAAWQPAVYCLAGEGELVAALRDRGISTTCLVARSAFDFRILIKLARQLKRNRPALLQTFLYHANIIGRVAGWMAGVPHIVSGLRVAEKRKGLRLTVDRLTERLVDCHVCVSRDVARFSIEHGGLSERKVIVIPNGVDAARFSKAAPRDLTEFGIPAGSRVVLFVGRLDPQKRPLWLLDALREILADDRGVHVLLVGDGAQRAQIEPWIREHDCAANVHLIGRCDDVPALMRASTLLALPSAWEGQPNVVLEAMAAGLPVVATNVEGVSELIRHDVSGMIVPVDARGEFATAIRGLLDDPARREAIGRESQAIAIKELTWDAVTAAYERRYLELLARGELIHASRAIPPS